MRPGALANADALPSTQRKPSFAASTPTANPRGNAPTSFFLARESDIDARNDSAAPSEQPVPPTVSSLEEAISGVSTTSEKSPGEDDTHSQRRRSTIKPGGSPDERSHPVQSHARLETSTPLTPIFLPTPGDASLPGSPKSISTRSLHNADEGSISDDVASQAVLSSGEDEEPEPTPEVQDSAPQLIMPSIKIPSRRPFTLKGRGLGRLKIMVAGSKGSGKTSLIKSIVQTCEDIVHIDPLESNTTPAASATLTRSRSSQSHTTETYASTKPYPSWWSEIDESRVLRRRKSLGDGVLERNICFVDTTPSKNGEHLIQYMEQQLRRAMGSPSMPNGDFLHLLSGSGGPQVDVVLFLIFKDTFSQDLATIKVLEETGNVVPLIAKSDTISDEEVQQLKVDIRNALTSRTARPFAFQASEEDNADLEPPYAISAAVSPDNDNMDASVLMSSEYIQPLKSSQLSFLVKKIFEKDTQAYLRHSAAKKLLSWRAQHPVLTEIPRTPRSVSPRPTTIGSPAFSATSASGVLIPYASDISLTTSNSYTLARLVDHTQREERLAQVRLAKWASDLQTSLNRERERYERLARGDRATWLVERMGDEIRDGRLQPISSSASRTRSPALAATNLHLQYASSAFATNDPMGLLKWNDDMKTRGWVALQVVGSFGVIGGLALWLAKAWGLNNFNNPFQSITEHVSGLQLKW